MPRSAQPAELLRKTILLFERCSRQQERIQLSRQRNCSTALCVFCRDGRKDALFPDLTLQIGDLTCGLLLPMAAKRIQDRLSVVLAGADDRTGVAIHRSAQRGNALLRITATTVDRLCKFELAVQDRSVQTVEAVLQIGVDPGEALAQRLLDTGKSCGHVVLDLTERIVLSRLRLSDIIQTCASFRRIFCSGNAQIGCNRADTVAIAESVTAPEEQHQNRKDSPCAATKAITIPAVWHTICKVEILLGYRMIAHFHHEFPHCLIWLIAMQDSQHNVLPSIHYHRQLPAINLKSQK